MTNFYTSTEEAKILVQVLEEFEQGKIRKLLPNDIQTLDSLDLSQTLDLIEETRERVNVCKTFF